MTETCAAYVAGLIDADGWISLHPNNQGTNWSNYTFMIGIVNKHLETLQWVQSMFGGTVRPRKRNQVAPHAKNWSQVYDWMADSECAEQFLHAVLPYMRIKKRQAEIMLEFLGTRQDRKVQYRLPKEVMERRGEMFREIKRLNHVGLIGPVSREVM